MLKDLDEFPMTDGVAVATCLSHKQCDQEMVSPSLQSAISFCIPTVLGESRRSKFKPLTGIVREFDFMYACLVALFFGFWQGQREVSSFCGLSPAAVLLAAYSVTCRGTLGRNDSLQEQLLLASKRKLYCTPNNSKCLLRTSPGLYQCLSISVQLNIRQLDFKNTS